MPNPFFAAPFLAIAFLTAGIAFADPVYIFRYRSGVLAGSDSGESLSISLVPAVPFGLTAGEEAMIPLATEGDLTGVSFRQAGSAFMAGLEVDVASGDVTGLPTESPGTEYRIAVEAVRDGEVVATSNTVVRTLRASLEIDYHPSELVLTHGEPFPNDLVPASASGGDIDSLRWSLENAPSWLDIVQTSYPDVAMLAQAADSEIETTAETTVRILVSDAEGREDSAELTVAVLPGPDKLLAADGKASDMFGHSVSAAEDGESVLVGAYFDGGRAYVFERNGDGWSQTRLPVHDLGVADQFGYSVALSADGNTAVIGARYQTVGSAVSAGSVYFYSRSGSGWNLQNKVSPGLWNEQFGHSVALSSDGSVAVIGTYHGSGSPTAAYVVERNGATWSDPVPLMPAVGDGDDFGYSVAIDDAGQTILVGAPGAASSGLAYSFSKMDGGWSAQGELIPANNPSGALFGSSVALSGNGSVAAVGAVADSGGAAHVFSATGSGWAHRQKIPAPASAREFGASIALSDNGARAMIGAPEYYFGDGAAYAYSGVPGSWTLESRLEAGDNDAWYSERYGTSIALDSSGRTAFIGAESGFNESWQQTGAVYVEPVP